MLPVEAVQGALRAHDAPQPAARHDAPPVLLLMLLLPLVRLQLRLVDAVRHVPAVRHDEAVVVVLFVAGHLRRTYLISRIVGFEIKCQK
jgi:hypothetical protein